MTEPGESDLFDLDPARLLARARFLAGYASRGGTESWPIAPNPYELLRRHPLDGQADELIPIDLAAEGATRDPIETADALRRAAMAALLVNPEEGRNYLLLSAGHYRQAGLPFGLFLRAAFAGDSEVVSDAFEQLVTVTRRGPRFEDRQSSPALEEPLQQLYLLITVAGDRRGRTAELLPVLARMPPARAWDTAGPAGIPLAEWWQFGVNLASLDSVGEVSFEVINQVLGHLVRLARAHDIAIRAMRRDTFNWERAHFRADLVDLVLVGISCMIYRRRRYEERPYWPFESYTLFDTLEEFDPVSMRAARLLAAMDDLRGDQPRAD